MKFWKSLFLSGLASAAVLPRDDPDNDKLASCPGYKATNVKTSASGLTADLTLAGKACNVYGDDLKQLTLEVAYQSGKHHKHTLATLLSQSHQLSPQLITNSLLIHLHSSILNH